MSTGNDIVALAATDQARTSSYRFYSRILTKTEQGLFCLLPAGALSFSQYVWLLWSIKEAAYKYNSRSNPPLIFAPLKIPVRNLTSGTPDGFFVAAVGDGEALLYSRSRLGDGVISTVVSEDPDFARTRSGFHRIGAADHASQSALVRELALRSLSAYYPHSALRIDKTPDGPPVVWDGDKPMDIPVSLAHHDCFVAWSYRLPA